MLIYWEKAKEVRHMHFIDWQVGGQLVLHPERSATCLWKPLPAPPRDQEPT
jgi:hypothetical protein